MAMLVCVSLCVSVCVYMTIKCIFKAHKTSKWPFCCCSQRRKIVIFAVKKAFEKCARQWNSLHRRKRGREKESVVRRGERARRTRMPHYKCSSLSLSLTIHKAAYLLHNGKTTIERANIHIHTCIHMYPHP